MNERLAQVMATLRSQYAFELPAKLAELERVLRSLRTQPQAEELKAARMVAHRLRGSAGSYGFDEVSSASGEIEVELDGWSEAIPPTGWDRINRALTRLVEIGHKALRLGSPSVASPVPPAGPPVVAVSPALAAGPGCVLVVDDDAGFLAAAQQLGRDALVEVLTATTRSQALALAAQRSIDALIVDVELGSGEDAFALARELRSLPGRTAVPLAFVSASTAIDARVAAAHAGASLFLGKPIDATAFEEAVRQLVAQRRARRARVLIVDDDPEFAGAVATVLEGHGYAATVELNATRVLAALDEVRPDALLLDLAMPGVGGLDVCRTLRIHPHWQSLPILFLTARDDAATRIEAFSAGADDYVTKPIVAPELLARLGARVERARLVREQAERDALTGLLLRRPFLEQLRGRAALAARHGRPLSLCWIDLDHFKRVNDEYGHLAGDRVLATLGNLLAVRFRAEDLRARWGGEEFLIAFSDEPPAIVGEVVARVQAEFAAITFEGDGGQPFHVGFSAGVAGLSGEGDTLGRTLRAADRQLYLAKEQGRGRVLVEETPASPTSLRPA